MKKFFSESGYDCVKLLVTQLAISLFGFALATATARSKVLVLVTSILSVIFYMFLLYSAAWTMGYRKHNAILHGATDIPVRGLLISLVANSFNFLWAILYTIGLPLMANGSGNLSAVSKVIVLLTEGMYDGILAEVYVGGVILRDWWWAYFAIIIPSLVVTALAYEMGLRDKKMTKLFNEPYPDSDREIKKK